jgi:MYXO-CTERM domain-containing protein
MRTLSLAAFAVAVLALAGTAGAQARTFNLTLTGANEPNGAGQLGQGDPDGVAVGTVTLDPATDMVSWDFNYSNISGEAISGFHIHGPGATPTTNKGIYIGLLPLSSTAVPNGREAGMVMSDTISDLSDRIDAVLANPSGFYVNLHSNGTGGFPGGSVRAQLPEPGALGLLGVAALGLLRRRRAARQAGAPAARPITRTTR